VLLWCVVHDSMFCENVLAMSIAAALARWRAFPFALVLVAGIASAQSTTELANLINAYRSEPQTCAGATVTAAGPLASNPVLARAQFAAGGRLLDELKARGYQGAVAYVIAVTGPSNPGDVMKLIESRYCRALSGPQYTEMGVRRDAKNWQIVLARPLLSPDLRDWRTTGMQILQLVNAARAQPRACGNRRFEPARALTWDDKLAAAALAHSRDMAAGNYMDHVGKDGSHPDQRATRQGYVWQTVGENVAAGQGSAERVMSGWLASPGHCASIMNAQFTQMGAAYALNPRSDAGIYWTQVFGAPKQ